MEEGMKKIHIGKSSWIALILGLFLVVALGLVFVKSVHPQKSALAAVSGQGLIPAYYGVKPVNECIENLAFAMFESNSFEEYDGNGLIPARFLEGYSSNNPELERLVHYKSRFYYLSDMEYDSVFVSMFSHDYFDSKYFSVNMGKNTAIISKNIIETKDWNNIIKAIEDSDNQVSTFYFGLDYSMTDDSASSALFEEVCEYIDKNKATEFRILASYPSLDFWSGLTDEVFDSMKNRMETSLNELVGKENCKVFFPGSESWLMSNKNNYVDEYSQTNPQVTGKVVLLTFCDGKYLLTKDMIAATMEKLEKNVEYERSNRRKYADLSDKCAVFVGDSVMAIDSSTTSIPGVVAALTGAECINLGIGGISAQENKEGSVCLDVMTDAMILGQHIEGCDFFNGEIDRFEMCCDNNQDYSNLLIFIEFGLNDYFWGINPGEESFEEGSYADALRRNVEKIREAYPEAYLVLLSPNRIVSCDCGNALIAPANATLEAYAFAVSNVAQLEECDFLDIFSKTDFEFETLYGFLQDEIHPGLSGRFFIGQEISAFLKR